MIELLFKLFVTILVIAIVFISLKWMWQQQIDVVESVKRFIKGKTLEKSDWLATRDQNAIYQNNEIVGNVSERVEQIDQNIMFREICNTSKLNHNMPFEYKRDKFRVINIGSIIGLYSSVSTIRSEVKHNVLKNVLCEKVK